MAANERDVVLFERGVEDREWREGNEEGGG
jgi:hypothetical protein